MTGSDMPFTADQIEEIFQAALSAGDVEGTVAAIRVMAAIDPCHASVLYDELEFALALADRRPTGGQAS